MTQLIPPRRLLLAPKRRKPREIGGLVLWLVAADLMLLDGGAVSIWLDRSGKGNHALQTTAANRPTLKINVIAGQPVVRFDGVDDYLVTAAFGVAAGQPNTIFTVARENTIASDDVFVDGLGAGRNIMRGLGTGAYNLFAGLSVSEGVGTRATGAKVLSATFNGASSTLYKNGTSILTGDVGAQALNGVTIGAYADVPTTGNLDGDIPEIIVYNRNLSTGERKLIEGYLGQYYRIAVV